MAAHARTGHAGIVVDGPAELLGREVWGSGGELGIRRDGAHAQYVVLDAARLREKPANISLAEAGAVGVPFITAYEGLRKAGSVQPGMWCWCSGRMAKSARW